MSLLGEGGAEGFRAAQTGYGFRAARTGHGLNSLLEGRRMRILREVITFQRAVRPRNVGIRLPGRGNAGASWGGGGGGFVTAGSVSARVQGEKWRVAQNMRAILITCVCVSSVGSQLGCADGSQNDARVCAVIPRS